MAQILVIDDDDGTRTMLKEVLASAGHNVVLTADGREGINQYRARPADLVITDLFMPNQEGLETIIELLKEFPESVIVAISGNVAATPMLEVARQFGAAEVLQKPFFPEQLVEIVGDLLRSRSKIV